MKDYIFVTKTGVEVHAVDDPGKAIRIPKRDETSLFLIETVKIYDCELQVFADNSMARGKILEVLLNHLPNTFKFPIRIEYKYPHIYSKVIKI